ncbi:GRB2-associated-binding protein 3 [Varanus komodoensis]|uniref:GRB2 associated binding protein 3 n=1 Tax=Varanus komodoensis TaxID=61221 RepID=A0A8D2KZJ0_VARKO|nr:GRB2-associated-binding protein 3 [Varanus komodoensis]
MSGNPDVLEYYRSSHSKKPIRVIDLNECEVVKHSGASFIKKEFQNNFVFMVKTTYRTFYLVAKSEEEMQAWVHHITQICNFGHLEDGTDSGDSLSHTTSSPQPSPAASAHALRIVDPSFPPDQTPADASAAEETASEPESVFLTDYLILSNCATGKLSHGRCHSWSNSDRSLEQTSSDDIFVDFMASQPSLYLQPSGTLLQELTSQGLLARNTDSSGPPSSDFSSSSPLSGPPLTPTFLADKSQNSLSCGVSEREVLANTPPPRPPKPTRLSDRRPEELSLGALPNGHAGFSGAHGALVPRRISVSSLDSMRSWRVDMEENSLRHRDKRLSLNLPCRFSPLYSCTSSSKDSYVPMRPSASPPISGSSDCTADGYIPMSPGSTAFTLAAASTEKLCSPLPELPTDLEPPPVNRELKPRRKFRPPPLDLRNLSTIREHAALTRTWTVPYNRTSFISPERDGINSARVFASSISGAEEATYIQMDHQQATSPYNGAFQWPKKFSLDYLALDFNSASPSPVQKKPFFSEEQRVDYVQVDEQRTQALQNTKQEWTDERQSKV